MRMTARPSLPLLLLVCCSLFAATGLALPAIAAEPITSRIEVFGFAGVHVLELRGRTDESGGRYSVALNYATSGLAKVFVDLTTQVQVVGRLVNGVAEPTQFRNASRRNGVARRTRLDYQPDGTIGASVEPTPPDPIMADRLRGTIDNLTAYFRLERQVAATGRCASTARVFDGRHAYDLVFSDLGTKTLSPTGGQNFTGQTIACHMERHIWPDVRDPEADEGAHSGTLWYARLLPGDLMVPVRTRMDTQLGVVDAFLAELHSGDVNLNLMP
jgi:hypothetical protein